MFFFFFLTITAMITKKKKKNPREWSDTMNLMKQLLDFSAAYHTILQTFTELWKDWTQFNKVFLFHGL